ncbi:MAG TPA: sigma-70 family RNA polymerase sigma factor [Planctomycetota bacterium]|nr:sigma-70 family RNA polymerase sigma factor [Planctomycetota bacterium]
MNPDCKLGTELPVPEGGSSALGLRLQAYQQLLRRFIRRHARGLLRFEAIEDVLQEINLEVLQAEDRFVVLGDKQLRSWLFRLARQQIASRYRRLFATRRHLGKVFKIAPSCETQDGGPPRVVLAACLPGPTNCALEAEDLSLLSKVITVLLPRDRDILLSSIAGVPVEELAPCLGLSRESAQRARLRALDRARAMFAALAQSRTRTGGSTAPASSSAGYSA